MTAVFEPGFAEPGRDSQVVFRAILDAMARPGRIFTVEAPESPPPPLDRSTAAVLLTLVDADTPVWMDDRALAAKDWVSFHCGSPFADQEGARFGVVLETPFLNLFHPGTDEEPETSATLIVQVAALGSGTAFQLSGPGLAAPTRLSVAGLAEDFAPAWELNRRRFPCGIDLILCSGDCMTALPRTVHLEAS